AEIGLAPVARATRPTLNELLIRLVKPVAEAVNCLFVPASVHSTLLKVTMPLPTAVPMSNAVVPRSEPEPAVRASVTFKLAGNPTVERLPNGSCDLRTGCVTSGDPVRERPPGWVVNTRRSAVLGLTTTLAETALVKPEAVAVMVCVPAVLNVRLERVRVPKTKVRLPVAPPLSSAIVALLSVVVMVTVFVARPATFQLASTALTMMPLAIAAPAVWAKGVPVLPVGVPG